MLPRMVARIQSCLLRGVDADRCEVEVDLDEAGLEKATVVGLPDAAVKESLERVRSALANAGYPVSAGRLLINLAPADVRKEGPVYDLPVAIGLLTAQGVVRPRGERNGAAGGGLDPRSLVFAGELALDGRVRPVKGAIAMAAHARAAGYAGFVCPRENAAEAAVVQGLDVFGVGSIGEVVGLLSGHVDAEPLPPPDVQGLLRSAESDVDFGDIKGQEAVKRAVTLAAAGEHNLLMIGPAGSGKTMTARALPGVLPPLTPAEALELTRIYSAAGMLPPGECLVRTRPVRSPHHTASAAAIVGGGVIPRPGEITLSHRGVLFLDELPEFGRGVLETLRQPLEDRVVTIARSHGSVRFPASFMLVAAMNPTPRGDVAPGEAGRREMRQYLGRLSGPLLDRIDIHVEAPAVKFDELSGMKRGTDSAAMRERVLAARERAASRQGTGVPNGRLSGRQLDAVAPIEAAALELLRRAIEELGLSARAYDKIRRLALTIADVDGAERIGPMQVAEAVQYRLLDRNL